VDNITTIKLNELIEDITLSPGYKSIFNEKFKARCLRPFKLTGHIDKDSKYIVHKENFSDRVNKRTQLPGKFTGPRKPRQNTGPLANIPPAFSQRPPGPGGMKGPLMTNRKPGFMGQDPSVGGRRDNPLMMGSSLMGGQLGGVGNPLMNNPLMGGSLMSNPLMGNPMMGNPMMGNQMTNPLTGLKPPGMNPMANLLTNPLVGAPLQNQRPPQSQSDSNDNTKDASTK